MIHIDTEIRHIAEKVLENMYIYDVKDFIEEYGNEKQIKQMNELKEED